MLMNVDMNDHNRKHGERQPHPRWDSLIQWLASHGMDISPENLPVISLATLGAGYGLFSLQSIEPSKKLFSIPAKALLNTLTLAPHYPPTTPALTCTQFVSLHLMVHRPLDGQESLDPLFGPYISVLPRSFDFHPLTWLWKQRCPNKPELDNQLMHALPPRILDKLKKISTLFYKDWERIQTYLQSHPELLGKRVPITGISAFEEDYLWGWLNVNTRCVYHRLAKSPSDQDNMTLCPILDFANHTTTPPYTMPQTAQAELWDTGPSIKRKFGDNFHLLSPPVPTFPDEELFLRYGAHSNATLFVEYGFVSCLSPRRLDDESSGGEIDLGIVMEGLFQKRAEMGSWMKEVLLSEGYWGDWTLHSSPPPAHPSYRVITALRLYHLLPMSAKAIPLDKDELLREWRDTTLGKRLIISAENESLWRATLLKLCAGLIKEAVHRVNEVSMINCKEDVVWMKSAKDCVESLWREEVDVATAVIQSLDRNEEF